MRYIKTRRSTMKCEAPAYGAAGSFIFPALRLGAFRCRGGGSGSGSGRACPASGVERGVEPFEVDRLALAPDDAGGSAHVGGQRGVGR